MIRHGPLAGLARRRTKSRLRSVSVCARITRAPHAQPSALSTIAVGSCPVCGRKPSSTISSGSAGRTRKTLVTQREALVGDAAEEAGGHADEHRQHRGDHAVSKPEHDGRARSRRATARGRPPGRAWCRAGGGGSAPAAAPASWSPIGSYGAIAGPMIAISTKNAEDPPPIFAFSGSDAEQSADAARARRDGRRSERSCDRHQ